MGENKKLFAQMAGAAVGGSMGGPQGAMVGAQVGGSLVQEDEGGKQSFGVDGNTLSSIMSASTSGAGGGGFNMDSLFPKDVNAGTPGAVKLPGGGFGIPIGEGGVPDSSGGGDMSIDTIKSLMDLLGSGEDQESGNMGQFADILKSLTENFGQGGISGQQSQQQMTPMQFPSLSQPHQVSLQQTNMGNLMGQMGISDFEKLASGVLRKGLY